MIALHRRLPGPTLCAFAQWQDGSSKDDFIAVPVRACCRPTGAGGEWRKTAWLAWPLLPPSTRARANARASEREMDAVCARQECQHWRRRLHARAATRPWTTADAHPTHEHWRGGSLERELLAKCDRGARGAIRKLPLRRQSARPEPAVAARLACHVTFTEHPPPPAKARKSRGIVMSIMVSSPYESLQTRRKSLMFNKNSNQP